MRTGDALSALWFFLGPITLVLAVICVGRAARYVRRERSK